MSHLLALAECSDQNLWGLLGFEINNHAVMKIMHKYVWNVIVGV